MSKLAFLTMVTLVAAILSLSMFAQAFASEESHATPVKPVTRNDKPIDNPVFVAKVPKPTNVRNFGDKGAQIGDFP